MLLTALQLHCLCVVCTLQWTESYRRFSICDGWSFSIDGRLVKGIV